MKLLPKLFKSQKGVSLYLAFMIMVVVLSISFGISSIFLTQTETIRGMGYSVIAFYAADAGIERVLIQRESPSSLNGYSAVLSNGASYTILVLSAGGSCTASNYCIKSVGNYKETNRAIEINY